MPIKLTISWAPLIFRLVQRCFGISSSILLFYHPCITCELFSVLIDLVFLQYRTGLGLSMKKNLGRLRMRFRQSLWTLFSEALVPETPLLRIFESDAICFFLRWSHLHFSSDQTSSISAILFRWQLISAFAAISTLVPRIFAMNSGVGKWSCQNSTWEHK